MSKEEFLIEFGKQVEARRKALNLSYRQLAQRCDIDSSDISKIEKGQKRIQLTTVFEICKGLDIHPRELFDFDFDTGKGLF
ncbi:MAG: XRE family transcriptional regulator [Moraxellaceae bacterium]|nr:MAG: XRE family transcriptional regulator [Moraxellaceae bacterium]